MEVYQAPPILADVLPLGVQTLSSKTTDGLGEEELHIINQLFDNPIYAQMQLEEGIALLEKYAGMLARFPKPVTMRRNHLHTGASYLGIRVDIVNHTRFEDLFSGSISFFEHNKSYLNAYPRFFFSILFSIRLLEYVFHLPFRDVDDNEVIDKSLREGRDTLSMVNVLLRDFEYRETPIDQVLCFAIVFSVFNEAEKLIVRSKTKKEIVEKEICLNKDELEEIFNPNAGGEVQVQRAEQLRRVEKVSGERTTLKRVSFPPSLLESVAEIADLRGVSFSRQVIDMCKHSLSQLPKEEHDPDLT